ncbi:hypothetical protein H632_c9p3 [Helicosporidium sp. ATCC 50920]|nr:hypothetical protein H632_c9p3 [Helicosporidium sp. ATCC 50920]|eukprot:KDD77145.1 hypothetical protein H632_c9p3 [Helicosporidium sp. ATCC 50920]
MAVPQWRASLAQAIRDNSHTREWSYMTLATVDRSNKPRARTVVFRGFLDAPGHSPHALTFTTDARSRKVDEVAQSASAEISWYFAGTREQFRLAGKLSVASASTPDPALKEARRGAWRATSEFGRAQFAGPAPGSARAAEPEPVAPPPGLEEDPPEPFCLAFLTVQAVDVVDLRDNTRWQHALGEDGGWLAREVHP